MVDKAPLVKGLEEPERLNRARAAQVRRRARIDAA